MNKLFSVLLLLLTSCATGPTPTSQLSEPERAALFAPRLQTDPNAELCQQIVARLDEDNAEAFTPFVDRTALVERALAGASLPADVAASWRRDAEQIDNLSRYLHPQGARFYCLGTVKFHGDDVLAVRGRVGSRQWFHVLLHLSDNPARPIDDYFVVDTGLWHSQLQMFFEDERYKPYAAFHSEALALSFANKHDEVLVGWQALPADVRLTPIMFSHALNAVTTVTPAGGELGVSRFKAVASSIDTVFAEPLTRAAWQIIFRARLRDVQGALLAVDQLTTPLHDPLADELREWVRARP